MDLVLPLVLFVLLIGANAVFVAAEFSFVAVNRDRLAQAADAGDRAAARVAAAVRRLSFQLSGAQLGITASSLLVGYLAEPAIARLLTPLLQWLPGLGEAGTTAVALLLALVLATGIQMVLGELTPKNLAIARPEHTARLVAPLQLGFSTAARPLIAALNGAANAVVKGLGIEPKEELESVHTAEELGLLAGLSARAGLLPAATAGMLRRSLTFGEKDADQAMTPRTDVLFLPADASVADMLEHCRQVGRARLPVYSGDIDNVRGVAELRSAFGVRREDRGRVPVTAIMREPTLVPSSLPLPEVLRELGRQDAQLAVVVDEYGGVAGVITIEDLAEEVVGEFVDEDDRERTVPGPPASETPRARAREIGGVLRAHEVEERTGFRLPAGPYDTIAGLVLARLGHLPQVGESVEVDGWRITVVQMFRRRIERVRIEPLPAAEEEP